MIKAVLLDLDDTLLVNSPDRFTEAYLGALASYLEAEHGIESIAASLLAATWATIQANDPLTTNAETFFAAFEPHLSVDRAAFDVAVAAFYAGVYPGLRRITQQKAAARPLVEWLLAQGYSVVVATNPFFPREAVEQRLAWAGLPVRDVPFALVTHLENMHYTKPHPTYYEEILARIGVQADEAVMVGDDWANDIEPAHAAGLNTFWITPDASRQLPEGSTFEPDGSGTLDDFACLVQEQHWLDTLSSLPLLPSFLVPRFNGNLAALMGIAREVPADVWQMRPDSGEWSPIEVVCHLAESEGEVQRPRLQRIIDEDNPFLSQPKTPPAPAARVCPQDVWLVAMTFARERRRTVELLTSVKGDTWQRPARHYIFGPTTLLEMADFTAQHDRLHLVQLCHTIAQCLPGQ